MKERLNKLLTVKSIVTMLMTIVFCVLSIKGVINGQEFLTVFTTVIAFYYGTQSAKNVAAADYPADAKAVTVNENAVLPGIAELKPPDHEGADEV